MRICLFLLPLVLPGLLAGQEGGAGSPALEELQRVLEAADSAGRGRSTLEVTVERLVALRPRLPDSPELAYGLGSTYLDLAGLLGGRSPYYDLATVELQRAFELSPDEPPIRAKLASLFAKLGRSEESVELLVAGLAQHPDYAPFHHTLGYVLRYAGLMDESMEGYRRSRELDSSPANRISAQDQITKSLIYQGRYDEALDSHRRMLAVGAEAGRPVDEKQWFYEGVIHLYRGDVDSAVDAFRSGRALDPGSVWTTFGRAYEGMALGDKSAVESVLKELENREVVDGERHYRLVHFAAFLGDVERGAAHLRKSTEGGFFNGPYLADDPWTAVLRGSTEVDGLIESARRRGEAVRKLLRH